jgi:hypothetical protein
MVGSFNYRRAIEERCFLLVPLMELATFRRAALERAFVQATGTGPWDALDREGILPPVAYLPEGTGFLTDLEALEAGDLVLREEHSYVPWGEKGLRPKCRRNGKKVQLSSSDS